MHESGSTAPDAPPRIGPNAVLQTLRALAELESGALADAVAERAGLPDRHPTRMIPEAWFVDLVRAVRETLPAERAEAVLRRSGQYTADYVRANRIPAPLRGLLAVLPGRLGIPLLLSAFRRHAWTFAGAGRFQAVGAYPGTIVLEGCPTCRPAAGVGRLSSSAGGDGVGGAYYEAAFQGLLGLAAPGVAVREVACRSRAAPACRFQILTTAALATPSGEPRCASS